MSVKNPVTLPGIDPGRVLLVAQRLRAPYLIGTGFSSPVQKRYGTNLTTHVYLAPVFKWVELCFHAKQACAFMAWTEVRLLIFRSVDAEPQKV